MTASENIRYEFPATLAEALELQGKAATRGRPLAGGTDLAAQWAAGVPVPERVVVLRGLKELEGIALDRERGVAWVGAGVTHARIRDHEGLKEVLPALAAASGSVGAAQIQQVGTVGGNACNASPAGDTAPALLVTGGWAVAASAARGRRRIPLEGFWTGYRTLALETDELLVGFELPFRGSAVERFTKVGTRKAQAISKIMAASRIEVAGGRLGAVAIAMGSLAATPIRLGAVEKLLAGKRLTKALVAEAEVLAQAEAKPIADIRSTAEYRKWMAGRLVREALEALG
jgi:carbon-monoxide dehydrogenase medium subunit